MRPVFALVGLSLLVAAIGLNTHIHLFINLPSFIIVVGCSLTFTLAYHSADRVFKAFIAALSDGRLNRNESLQHQSVLSTIRVITSASGVIGTLIGLVSMLAKMDDPKSIGPAMAVALLTALYAVIIAELLIAPLINRLKTLTDSDTTQSGNDQIKVSMVTLTSIPLALIAFFVVWLSLTGT